jgi:hypothetical protein
MRSINTPYFRQNNSLLLKLTNGKRKNIISGEIFSEKFSDCTRVCCIAIYRVALLKKPRVDQCYEINWQQTRVNQ